MNILPKKRWHVRNRENIARVRKDEAAVASEEKERENRRRRAEQEAKIEILRSQIKQKSCCDLKFDDESTPKTSKAQHINFFETVETLGKNEEHERELKEEKEKYEKQIGYLTYLGQETNEASGHVSWYNQSKYDFGRFLKINSEKNEKSKSALDPLSGLDAILTKKRRFINNVGECLKLEKKEMKLTSTDDEVAKRTFKVSVGAEIGDKDASLCETEEKEAKKRKIERLREKRLKREREEKIKIERLLIEVKQGKECGFIKERKFLTKFQQKYNSQFHPHLARQNHSE